MEIACLSVWMYSVVIFVAFGLPIEAKSAAVKEYLLLGKLMYFSHVAHALRDTNANPDADITHMCNCHIQTKKQDANESAKTFSRTVSAPFDWLGSLPLLSEQAIYNLNLCCRSASRSVPFACSSRKSSDKCPELPFVVHVVRRVYSIVKIEQSSSKRCFRVTGTLEFHEL